MTHERLDTHAQHEDERARYTLEKRAREAEERWQRRLWAAMPVSEIASSGDFWGSKL